MLFYTAPLLVNFKMRLKKILISAYYKILAFREKFKYRSKVRVHRFATWFRGFFADKTPDYEKISKCKRLIVCAHPDDETLFFFSVMGEGTYVICMSNCGEKTRRKEFFNALEYQNTEGVIFNFPDLEHSEWMWSKIFLKRRFRKIRNVLNKECEIYTHSVEGESGHCHHFATGRFVGDYFRDFKIRYTAINSDDAKKLSDDDLKEKMYIMTDIYSSQIKMLTRWCSWFNDYIRIDSFLK